MEPRRDLGAVAFALANVAVEAARLPLGALERLPGMGLLSREGAWVRARARSRLEGVLADALRAPEAERALDRLLAGALPDRLARSMLEYHVVERFAAELVQGIDVDAAVAAALNHPAFDDLVLRVQAAAARGASPDSGDAAQPVPA